MSAELLREAATLMRERAQAVADVKGPPEGWYARIRESDGAAWICDEDGSLLSAHGFPTHAEHIASWHPAVALAVADWLEATWELAPPDPHHVGEHCETCENVDRALTVARAYLGRDA